MVGLVWLLPALPLAGFLILVFFGKRIGEPRAGWIGTGAVALSFVTACVVFAGLWGEPEHTYELSLFEWIPAGNFSVDIGFLLDPLSMAMVLFVTGIASLIHLYSIGYMHGDSRFPRFFTYLNLFVFSMLVLVLGDNLVLTFLGWEGVGACSYFLIAFWFEKDENASAGKKAFITNRVGDWGFMVAIFMTFFAFGTVTYTEFLPLSPGLAETTATFIALMLFVGAIGKSAQIPLFIWLPDAMAGPTPVSALIHAATMVTAGVYLLVRVNPIIAASASWIPWMIAIVGIATAFLAATIAMAQQDIKKVLAYSTVSQLGYMFLAIGVGGYTAAIFHMITHAFFKALLFLGSGSVIHGVEHGAHHVHAHAGHGNGHGNDHGHDAAHGEHSDEHHDGHAAPKLIPRPDGALNPDDPQDMRNMGGLLGRMPRTAITFIIGGLALSGFPFITAGFWSKDEILASAWYNGNTIVFWTLAVAAFLTAFYTMRQIGLSFLGTARTEMAAHAPESVAAMTIPLILITPFAIHCRINF